MDDSVLTILFSIISIFILIGIGIKLFKTESNLFTKVLFIILVTFSVLTILISNFLQNTIHPSSKLTIATVLPLNLYFLFVSYKRILHNISNLKKNKDSIQSIILILIYSVTLLIPLVVVGFLFLLAVLIKLFPL